MNSVILKKNTDIYKIITAVIIALIPVHPFYTLYINWPAALKIVFILIFLGVKKYYIFKHNEVYVIIKFLKITLLKKQYFLGQIKSVLVYKPQQQTFFELQLVSFKKTETIITSSNYFYISNVACQISHLLQLDLQVQIKTYD